MFDSACVICGLFFGAVFCISCISLCARALSRLLDGSVAPQTIDVLKVNYPAALVKRAENSVNLLLLDAGLLSQLFQGHWLLGQPYQDLSRKINVHVLLTIFIDPGVLYLLSEGVLEEPRLPSLSKRKTFQARNIDPLSLRNSKAQIIC